MSETRVAWHLCSNRWNSAITEYALRSAQALKLAGWHSELSALPSSPCERRAKDYGIGGPSFSFRLRDLFRLRAFAKTLKPSVIITYGGPETFLARFLGAPVVRFRGQDSDLTAPLSAFGLRANLGHCRAVLTPAKAVRDRFRTVLPDKAIESVTLGLDHKVFHAMEGRRERPILLIVGRLDPVKGHAPFLAMFRELLDSLTADDPRPYLEIIGQSSNVSADDLHQRAGELRLIRGHDYEIVDQRVEDLPERMARAQLGVVPSLGSEVIGRVTEEFLLSGTPVLVAPVGTLAECLREESFGAVLSPDSLRLWLKRSWEEDFAAKQLRSQQAQLAFSLETMGEQLSDFLLHCLRDR